MFEDSEMAGHMTENIVITGRTAYIGARTVAQLLNAGAHVSDLQEASDTVPDLPGKQLLSIVIPCYNEEEVIGETIRQLKKLCGALPDLDTELIFVDDGSRDRTRELLKSFAITDRRISVIGFARN